MSQELRVSRNIRTVRQLLRTIPILLLGLGGTQYMILFSREGLRPLTSGYLLFIPLSFIASLGQLAASIMIRGERKCLVSIVACFIVGMVFCSCVFVLVYLDSTNIRGNGILASILVSVVLSGPGLAVNVVSFVYARRAARDMAAIIEADQTHERPQ